MSGQPSIPGRGLGSPRNGMPPSVPYAYRGTGRALSLREAAARLRGQAPACQPAPAPRRLPAPPAPAVRLAELERELASRGVIEPGEPVPYWPAYYPGPGVPGRCPGCGYMTGASGHQVTCGGEA